MLIASVFRSNCSYGLEVNDYEGLCRFGPMSVHNTNQLVSFLFFLL